MSSNTTHWPDCATEGGPEHYECAVAKIAGWAELKDALAEAGHPLTNDNGNRMLNALRALIAERDEALRRLDRPARLTSA